MKRWLMLIQDADWENPSDILNLFPSADLLGKGSDRVVFDIAGNNYRIICKYWFGVSKVHLYIKWMGTHALYTRLCAQNKQFTVDDI